MKKIITILIILVAFGKMSYGSQISYPASLVLISKFKSNLDYTKFKGGNRLKENTKLSDCKIKVIKYGGKTWHESRSTVMIQKSNLYKSWPNDVLKGYIEIVTPKNKHGEVITATYAIVYNRTEKNYDGTLRLENKWIFKDVTLVEMLVNPIPITNKIVDPLVKYHILHEYKFQKKLLNQIIRIDSIYWDKKGSVSYIDGLTVKNYEGSRLFNAATWDVPIVIEAILQHTEYGELKTEKVKLRGQATIMRDYQKDDKWALFSFGNVTSFKRITVENKDNKRYGALSFYNGVDVYKKYMPYKVKPNSEEGKIEFGKMIHAKLLSFTYSIETKDEVISEIQKLSWNNNVNFATNIWESFYRLTCLQLTLNQMEIGHSFYPVKKGNEDDKKISSDFNVMYKASRKLSKAEIKILKKKYDKIKYYNYWIKSLENEKFTVTYRFVYENNKWTIKESTIGYL